MIKRLKNMLSIGSISRRIRAAFVSVLLLLFFSGMISLFELERVSHDTEEILMASKENVDLAGDMISALNEQNDMMITMAVSSGKFSEIKRYQARCEETISKLAKSSVVAQRHMQKTDTPEAADSLVMYANRINELTRSYIDGDVHRTIALALSDSTKTAPTTHEWYVNKYKPEYVHTSEQITRYMTGTQSSLGPDVNNLSHTARRAVTPVFISLVVMVVIVIMFYFLMMHYFVRPILRINRSLGDFITYKKPFDESIKCRDEIAMLRDRVAAIVTKIRQS
jgi:rRNA-processing protein FCF1